MLPGFESSLENLGWKYELYKTLQELTKHDWNRINSHLLEHSEVHLHNIRREGGKSLVILEGREGIPL